MDLVSIIIPVYNAQKTLNRCIESILNQTYEYFEIILINDGSIDKSLELCEYFISHDKRIKLYSQPNSGPSAARNKGIKYANGKFICFVDADDFLSDKYLEILIAPFNQGDIQLTCAGYFEISKYNKNPLPINDFLKFVDNDFIDVNDFHDNLFKGTSGVLWNKMFISYIIKNKSILFQEHINFSEDLIFILMYSKFISRIAVLPEYIIFYDRSSENGLSSDYSEKLIENILLTNNLIKGILLSPKYDTFLNNRLRRGLFDYFTHIALSKIENKKLKILNYLYVYRTIFSLKFSRVNLNNILYLLLFYKKINIFIFIVSISSLYRKTKYK